MSTLAEQALSKNCIKTNTDACKKGFDIEVNLTTICNKTNGRLVCKYPIANVYFVVYEDRSAIIFNAIFHKFDLSLDSVKVFADWNELYDGIKLNNTILYENISFKERETVSFIRANHIDFWIQNNLNVLFIGEHGVGKTTLVKDAFERNNIKYLYFSASTLDPFTDLVGIPKEKTDNGLSFLEFIMPKYMQDPTIEALFFDEFNRGSKKINNAVMELIQFKSINGRPFGNIRMVWAAINPHEGDNYSVEELDPAQRDRFQIQVHIPYKPDHAYFKNKFGSIMADGAVDWWNKLPKEVKPEISPRRLDYALEVYQKDGDMRFVLPRQANVSDLIKALNEGPIQKKIEQMFKFKDPIETASFMANEDNYSHAIDAILANKDWTDWFVPHLRDEKIAALAATKKSVKDMLIKRIHEPKFAKVVKDIIEANANEALVKELKQYVVAVPTSNWKPILANTLFRVTDLGTTDSNERFESYDYIRTQMPQNIDVTTAKATLAILYEIRNRSQWNTRQSKMPFLNDMINWCDNVIHGKGPF